MLSYEPPIALDLGSVEEETLGATQGNSMDQMAKWYAGDEDEEEGNPFDLTS